MNKRPWGVKALICLLLALAVLSPAVFMVLPATAMTPIYTVGQAYKSTDYYKKLVDLKLTGDMRRDVVAIALTQVGYHGGNSEEEMDGANYQGEKQFTEYNRYYGKIGGTYSYSWCAVFVTWCLRMAGVSKNTVANFASCSTCVRNLQSKNVFKMKSTGYIPVTGDIIFFSDVGSGYLATHVGFVVGVEKNYVYTVEGNAANSVMVRRYDIDDPYVVGYGVPDYTVKSGTDYTFPLNYTLHKKGQYVLDKDVTLRSGPGEEFAVVGTLPAGTKVNAEFTSRAWGRISYGVKPTETTTAAPVTTVTPVTTAEPVTMVAPVTTVEPVTTFDPVTTAEPLITTPVTTVPDITEEITTAPAVTAPTPEDVTVAPETSSPEPETSVLDEHSEFQDAPAANTGYAWFPLSAGTLTVLEDGTVVPTEHSISYDMNGGGKAPATVKDSVKKSLTVTSEIPTRTGYTFKGWGVTKLSVTSDFAAGEKYSGADDLILYAIWDPHPCTVTFVDEDGTTVLSSGLTYYGSIFSEPKMRDKTVNGIKYVFTGWSPALPKVVSGDATYRAVYSVASATTAEVTTVEPVTSEIPSDVTTVPDEVTTEADISSDVTTATPPITTAPDISAVPGTASDPVSVETGENSSVPDQSDVPDTSADMTHEPLGFIDPDVRVAFIVSCVLFVAIAAAIVIVFAKSKNR